MITYEGEGEDAIELRVRELARKRFGDVALLIHQEQTAGKGTKRFSRKVKGGLSPTSSVLSLQLSPFLSAHSKLSQTKSCNFQEPPPQARAPAEEKLDEPDFGTWPRKRTFNLKAYGLLHSPILERSKHQRRSRTDNSSSSGGSFGGHSLMEAFKAGEIKENTDPNIPVIGAIYDTDGTNLLEELPESTQTTMIQTSGKEAENQPLTSPDEDTQASSDVVSKQDVPKEDVDVGGAVCDSESKPHYPSEETGYVEDVVGNDCVCDDPSNGVTPLSSSAFTEHCSKDVGKASLFEEEMDRVVDDTVMTSMLHSFGSHGKEKMSTLTDLSIKTIVTLNVNENNNNSVANVPPTVTQSHHKSLKKSVRSSFCTSL